MKTSAVFFEGKQNVYIKDIELDDPQCDEIQVETIVNGICMFEVWAYNSGEWTDKPFIPGHEGIGVVTKVGNRIKDVKEGDIVTCYQFAKHSNLSNGDYLKIEKQYDDYSKIMIEPASCAVVAAHFSKIQPAERAIVFGAGYMGLLLIQMLKHYPLREIVVVDYKEYNLKLAKEYGATKVVNLSSPKGNEILESFKKMPFDISYECSGAKSALDWCTKLTTWGGKIGIYSWHHEPRVIDTSAWHFNGFDVLNLSPGIARRQSKFIYFEMARDLMDSNLIDQSNLITHRYDFEDIEKAMKESCERGSGFVKSVITFH